MLLALGVIWGIPYLFIKIAVETFTPGTLVFLRVAFAAAVLLPIVIARGQWKELRGHWRWVLVFALIEMAFTWLALNWAEQYMASSLAALILATIPAVTAVFALIFRVEDRLSRGRVIGLVVGFAGVAALVGWEIGSTPVTALAAMIVVVVGYSIGPLVVDLKLSSLPSLAVIAGAMLINTVIFAPVALVQWPSEPIPSEAWIAALILGLICSALAFIIFFALIAEVGPARTTIITYINPVVAVLLGVLVLSEPFTVGMAIGFPLILVGSWLATRRAPVLESEPHA